jgi:hypothetical protein
VPIAETAELVANLKMNNQMGGPAREAEGEMSALNATTNRTASSVAVAGESMHKAGGHAVTLAGGLSHAKHALTDLISGPLGMIGLGAAGFGLTKFLDDAVKSTYELGNATIKLQQLTGGSMETASALLAIAEKYGISYNKLTQVAGFYEKTVGKLNEATVTGAKAGKSAALLALETEKLRLEAAGRTGKALSAINKQISEQTARDKLAAAALTGHAGALTKLQSLDQKYGLSLIDTKGHVVDFNTALAQIASAYQKTSDKSKLAYETSQLFGRGFAALMPIIAGVGKKGLLEAEQEAKDLGVTLTATTARDLVNARNASLAFGEAMQGLKIAIGTQVIPILTDLQKNVTAFLTHGGAQQIAGTVRAILGTARQVADVAAQIGGAFAKAWGMIPGPLQQVLIGGLVGNKVLKFAFGFSGLDILKTVAGGGGLLGRGGPGNPMHVIVDNNIPGGGAGGGGGGGGILGKVLGFGGAIFGGLSIAALWKGAVQDPQFQSMTDSIGASVNKQIAAKSTTRANLEQSLAALNTGIQNLSNVAGPLSGFLYGGQIDALTSQRDQVQAALDALDAQKTPKDTPTTKAVKDTTTATKTTGHQTVQQQQQSTRATTTSLAQHRQATVAATGRAAQTVQGAISAMNGAVVASLNGGFASVVAALTAIAGATSAAAAAAAASAASSAQVGPGTPGSPKLGPPAPRKATAAGGGQKLGPPLPQHFGTSMHIVVNSQVSPRSNDYANAIQGRYGPTPAMAGSQ